MSILGQLIPKIAEEGRLPVSSLPQGEQMLLFMKSLDQSQIDAIMRGGIFSEHQRDLFASLLMISRFSQ